MLLKVRVKPRSRVSGLAREADGTWLARIKAPPVDGRANEELVGLIAAHFNCLRAAVTVKSGVSGRIKLVRVDHS